MKCLLKRVDAAELKDDTENDNFAAIAMRELYDDLTIDSD